LLQKLRFHTHRTARGHLNGNICDFNSAATDRVEELVTHHAMTTEELHSLELELRTILERIDSIRSIARDLKYLPKLTAEDTTGLDKLEETLKESLKKDAW
jgi:hypothetical protein